MTKFKPSRAWLENMADAEDQCESVAAGAEDNKPITADAKRLETIRRRCKLWGNSVSMTATITSDMQWLLSQLDKLSAEVGPWIRLQKWIAVDKRRTYIMRPTGITVSRGNGRSTTSVSIDDVLALDKETWG